MYPLSAISTEKLPALSSRGQKLPELGRTEG